MASRKRDFVGTLIAGAVAMTIIVALVIWWRYHPTHALNPQAHSNWVHAGATLAADIAADCGQFVLHGS